MPRVAGNRDDVVEDDLVGKEVEEVVPVGEPIEALFDDAGERVERSEVVQAPAGCHGASSPAHAAAVRLAKSVKVPGGAPVTFSMSSLGREPRPEAMVSVSIWSIWPYSAGTPDAITLSTQERRSMSTCRTGRLVTLPVLSDREAMVSVSIWSIWPYSAGTPDAITLSTQERRSMSTCRTGRLVTLPMM